MTVTLGEPGLDRSPVAQRVLDLAEERRSVAVQDILSSTGLTRSIVDDAIVELLAEGRIRPQGEAYVLKDG